jgi:hypothetical protein
MVTGRGSRTPRRCMPPVYRCLAALWVCGLGGCGMAPEYAPSPEASTPAVVGVRPAEPKVARHLVIDDTTSALRILVYRDGRLAQLGHNHVLSGRGVRGSVALAEPIAGSTAELEIPLDKLVVDDPAERAAAGPEFATAPSAEAIAGTRGNLLGERVLDTARFPRVKAWIWVLGGTLPELEVAVELEIQATRRVERTHLTAYLSAAGLQVSGQLLLHPSDYGIVPFSVLMGALRVRDQVLVDFHLDARAPAAQAR